MPADYPGTATSRARPATPDPVRGMSGYLAANAPVYKHAGEVWRGYRNASEAVGRRLFESRAGCGSARVCLLPFGGRGAKTTEL